MSIKPVATRFASGGEKLEVPSFLIREVFRSGNGCHV
jgi:hypothetical protein